MIQRQIALIQRELWEHRALYVVPAVLILIVTLTSITGQVTVSAASQYVDIALLGASNLGDAERGAAINILMLGMSSMFVISMGIVAIFYALDCLYAERKDKSILFWRSLPVTDAETVVSKLLTALVLIPVISLVAIGVTHLFVLSVTSVWVGTRGADAGSLIWSAVPLLDNWSATFVFLLALSIWFAPFIAWFLFVSAYTRRSPFLFAFLPLIVVPMLEKILIGTTEFIDMLVSRAPFMVPIFRDMGADEFILDDEERLMDMAREGISLWSIVDIGGFVTSASVWLGLIVCALLTTAAIYVRRYRDDS